MDSTEFHARFHEAATRGLGRGWLRQLARMWSEESGRPAASLADRADAPLKLDRAHAAEDSTTPSRSD